MSDVAQKRLVDFQRVDLEMLEITQARIAGAEVVNRQPHAQRFQAIEHANGGVGIVHQHALGQLKFQTVRRQAGILQNARQVLQKIAVAELDSGNIDRDRYRWQACILP